MITEKAFLACIWFFLCMAVITTLYQLKVRGNPLSAPYDGTLAAAGLLFLFAHTLVLTLLTLDFFHLTLLPTESAQLHINNKYLELQLVSTALNTAGLWLVKLGSLAALYPLVNDSHHLQASWFSTGITVFISWALCTTCDPIALPLRALGKSSILRE